MVQGNKSISHRCPQGVHSTFVCVRVYPATCPRRRVHSNLHLPLRMAVSGEPAVIVCHALLVSHIRIRAAYGRTCYADVHVDAVFHPRGQHYGYVSGLRIERNKRFDASFENNDEKTSILQKWSNNRFSGFLAFFSVAEGSFLREKGGNDDVKATPPPLLSRRGFRESQFGYQKCRVTSSGFRY